MDTRKTDRGRGKITAATLQAMRARREPIAMLTCYDYPTARILQDAGVPMLLVGDSAANTILGLPSTREIPPEFLLELTKAVRRGAPDVFVLADMPFAGMASMAAAVELTRRFAVEAGADAVKVETTEADRPLVEALLRTGVPICVHLGLLPQRVTEPGGYKAQGRTSAEAERIIAEAVGWSRAGAQMLLLEAVPDEVSAEVVRQVSCPVIGCGAGPSCDGHVIVLHDVLGYNPKPPRFAQVFADAPALLAAAAAAYVAAVQTRAYPAEAHVYRMKKE